MKLFYLKNYKSIHHTTTILIYVALLSFIGIMPYILEEFLLQVLFLVASYFGTELALRVSGLEEYVLKELEKYNT